MMRAVLWLALLSVAGCASSPPTEPTTNQVVQTDDTLGAGDAFEVNVYDDKELSGKYRVADDGSIDFPLVGRIEVAGLGQAAIAQRIQQALQDKKILRNPQVSVFVTERSSKRVNVMGAVEKPGTLKLVSGMTVVQAISEAGGFTPLASRNDTIVTRRVEGKLQRFKVPVERITEGRSDDFPLKNGDIVYVPERIF